MKLNYFMDVEDESMAAQHTNISTSSNLPFMVTSSGYMKARGKYFTEREGRESYLLLYTLAGTGSLKYRNSEYILLEGQVAFIDCNEYQFYQTVGEGIWVFRWVHCNGTACKYFFDSLNENSLNIVNVLKTPQIELNLKKVTQLSTFTGILTDVQLSHHMNEIMTELLTSKILQRNNHSLKNHGKTIGLAIDYIQSNYNQPLRIDELAKSILLSKYHFSRLFKAGTGLSPYEYLIHYRVNISKSLLADTAMTVSEIAEKIGFGDTNNYIRYFKRICGMTPQKFRKFNVVL